jgi:catechol 2,3-dioxygenase-like lactoylglutathione lyase family enzyme
MIAIDHIAILARDVAASAQFLAEILGIPPGAPDGPEGEMFRLPVDQTASLLYFPAEEIRGQHLAFRVDRPTFDAVVARLRSKGLAFGNDPEDTANMQASDFLGGHGRVFFLDPDEHLFEVIA